MNRLPLCWVRAPAERERRKHFFKSARIVRVEVREVLKPKGGKP